MSTAKNRAAPWAAAATPPAKSETAKPDQPIAPTKTKGGLAAKLRTKPKAPISKRNAGGKLVRVKVKPKTPIRGRTSTRPRVQVKPPTPRPGRR